MTWKPPDGMSDKQIEKELQRQIVKFEDAVKEGQYYDSNIRFGDYGEEWLEMNRPPQLAPKTYECYKGMFRDIKEALGDIKLVKLQSRHLQMFYSNLRENGVKRTGAYNTIKIRRTSQYTAEKGIYTDTTKTKKSQRISKFPEAVMELLKRFQQEQSKEAQRLGSKWEDHDRLFTKWNGAPMHPQTPYK